jgi:hypothetical protein
LLRFDFTLVPVQVLALLGDAAATAVSSNSVGISFCNDNHGTNDGSGVSDENNKKK